MPIKIAENLPAREILNNENIFVMTEERAQHQDIRPLQIAILNLMPTKISTETQLLRLIGNSPLQVEITLLRIQNHQSKNTPEEHLTTFYQTFDQIRDLKYDGLIITGAPVENLPFEEVDYWDELVQIMDWSCSHVFSSFFICWGAQAAMYHFYGVPKYPLPAKQFGVFPHHINHRNVPLLRGFDDQFYVPHSRHTEVRREDIQKVSQLEILSESEEAGVYITLAKSERQVFVSGHSEYDSGTLKAEYERDVKLGLPIAIPRNYFPGNDPTCEPEVRWRSHANLLYVNWLNYYVYQATPYQLTAIQ